MSKKKQWVPFTFLALVYGDRRVVAAFDPADGRWFAFRFDGEIDDHTHAAIGRFKDFDVIKARAEKVLPEGVWIASGGLLRRWRNRGLWCVASLQPTASGRWAVDLTLSPHEHGFGVFDAHYHVRLGTFSTLGDAMRAAERWKMTAEVRRCVCKEAV